MQGEKGEVSVHNKKEFQRFKKTWQSAGPHEGERINQITIPSVVRKLNGN